MGKHWIRRFALELCKETLGQIRSKFQTIPIPGESVTLNGPALIQESLREKELLRKELTDKLDKLTYSALMASDADLVNSVDQIQQKIPMVITMG
jgi:hypothetical protein